MPRSRPRFPSARRAASAAWPLALLAVVLTTSPLAAQEDAPLGRSSLNPLMTKGPSGSIDQVKIGPRAMLREGPKDWKMWYEAVPAGNKSYAAYATSSDGLSWTKYAGNPVMSPSAAWEGGANNTTGETSPTSVLKEQGVYKLWYHGFSGGMRQIGFATSIDGLNWTKYSGNPVLKPGASGAWDADSICEPNVVHVGSTYYMYYSHCTGNGEIGLATSTDGVSWTKYAGNPVITTGSGWENQQVDWAGVYYDGQRFHLWYLGRSTTDTGGFSLGYASSTDGKTFSKTTKNPVLAPPTPPIISTNYSINKGDGIGIENSAKVFRLGNSWHFYYGGFASCCPEDATLCLATSNVLSSPNRAPIVDAGRDLTVTVGTSASLDGTVMDDDTPVTLDRVTSTWTKVSGPGAATFGDASSVDTTVSFDAPGTYVLRLSASDTALSGQATVTITVNPRSGTGGAGNGGSTGSGGIGGGGTRASGGTANGGMKATGGLGAGGTNASGGATSTSGGTNGVSGSGAAGARGGSTAQGGANVQTGSSSSCACRTVSRSTPGAVLIVPAIVVSLAFGRRTRRRR